MPDRLRIAYICDFSPLDTNSYSGGNNRIYNALQKHVGDVTILDAGWGMAEPLRKLCHALPEAINLRLRWRLHLALSRTIARHVHRQLMAEPFDVVFCAYSFQSMMNVRVPARMTSVFTADATPTTYKRSEVGESFGSFIKASRLLDPMILNAERRTFQPIDLTLWPTDWLKSGADDLYDLPHETSIVIPWGANIDAPPRMDLPPRLAQGKPVRLLLVGRDFHAKGGPLVLSVLEQLRHRDIDAQLDIIGAVPDGIELPEAVTFHGLLNKSSPGGLQKFQSIMSAAHFLVQPSFESYGFAFCEASAYGLPSLCLRVGGVPVRDGINGHALPAGASAQDFAALIQRYLASPDSYAALRESSRAEYENALNWDRWGERVADVLHAKRAGRLLSGLKSRS
ncbi:glycosyltransferase family 4 protein [Primorskyibacter sp. S187A]|uniref:glycosyltransferase family 4 protein n=1 Tax=Primorskyibacter sp. S187A TaxID=3415130 RepID=UPI003C7C1B8A